MRTFVTNVSAVTQNLGFLPPHGKTLAAGASTTVDGDLETVLAGGRGRYSRRSEIRALEEARAAGIITAHDVPDPSSSLSTE